MKHFNMGLGQSKRMALIQFHIAVFLWGFTAILGDLIDLPALSLVWWRVGISGVALIFYVWMYGDIRVLKEAGFWRFIGIGFVVGLHWLCFYGSIKLANASVALITMSSGALFTILLEWFLGMKRIDKKDVIFGVSVIPCMFIVVGGLDPGLNQGFLVGLLAAGLLALFTILNKRSMRSLDPAVITLLEMAGAWILLGGALLVFYIFDVRLDVVPDSRDWILLLILSLVCTVFPFILTLYALRKLSAFLTNFIFNLEPVYGILLAAWLLQDYRELTTSFYIGGAGILLLVFIYPVIKPVPEKEARTAE